MKCAVLMLFYSLYSGMHEVICYKEATNGAANKNNSKIKISNLKLLRYAYFSTFNQRILLYWTSQKYVHIFKVMGNEKKGGVKVVSFDRSWFSELSLLIFI